MRQIFIGDLQGCHQPLERLLDKLDFDPAGDRLRFCGDLVNRGGESLATLRRVHELRSSAMTVLGNHDLHLLAYAFARPDGARTNREFEQILADSMAEELLDWLRCQPLLWTDTDRRLAVVHAGIDPRWDPELASRCARQLEQTLQGPDFREFLANMYGNRPPAWEANQPSEEQLRTITNVFTRMRFCDEQGRLDFKTKGGPDDAPPGYRPWFDLLDSGWKNWRVIFGHWSVLGLYTDDRVYGLDTGCVWGGRLSALAVDGDRTDLVQVKCR